MDSTRKRILVLYWHPARLEEMRTATYQHLHALDGSSCNHRIIYYNAIHGAPSWLRRCSFDAVILHTTFLCLRWSHLFYNWKWHLRWIRDLQCLKIAMPQDEYDHSEILDEWLYEWGVSVIFTIFDRTTRQLLYPIMHNKAEFVECLTVYIDASVAVRWQEFLTESRPVDVVYRATHLPYWFGSHGQLKHQIADFVKNRASRHGLTCDISTRVEDTIVGDQWGKFLASGRAVIGCESGSSVLDRRGEIKAKIQALQRSNPSIEFREVGKYLPSGWDQYRFFALSPRHLEAVITKTCQILIEGAYSGLLEADKHYIPLQSDFSNVEEVLEKVRDERLVRDMVERAYSDVYLSDKYTYRAFTADLDRVLEKYRVDGIRPGKISVQVMWSLARLSARAP